MSLFLYLNTYEVIISVISWRYDLHAKSNTVTDISILNVENIVMTLLTSRGRLWAVQLERFAFIRWCKLERVRLPLFLTMNSTRRVWADASSGCLYQIISQAYRKKAGAIFGYFVWTRGECDCFLVWHLVQSWRDTSRFMVLGIRKR